MKHFDITDAAEKEDVEIEQTEYCPFCESENVFDGYKPEIRGYITTCKTCGCQIKLCDACMHADDNPGRKCDWREENGKSVCWRGSYEQPTYANVIARLPKVPQPDGKLWANCDEILGSEKEINLMADVLASCGIDVTTGFYDPEEDARSRETDRFTGYWYLDC